MRTMVNRFGLRGLSLGVLALGIVSASAWAHTDDPKPRDKQPPYLGPGFKRATDAAAAVGFPANGVNLQAWVPIGDFAGTHSAANDCWGYVAPSGREYAILGLSSGTGFVEVTDPTNPTVIAMLAGPGDTTWRDIKVYDTYAYAVTEATGSGIQVFDLSNIDNGQVTLQTTINTGGTTATHNVAIDETSGYLYRCGGSSNGLRIYDLANPANPVFVSEWTTRYVHDAQIFTHTTGPHAGRQIAYACSGANGGFVETGLDVLDVTDKQNIVEVGRLILPNGEYSHQVWLSDDGLKCYLNDELDENGSILTTTFVIDVEHLAQPTLVSSFTSDNAAVGHNLYVRDNFIFEANYTSGLRVFDASDPLSPVEVAFFDTYEANDNPTFNGLWSTYPFFPSGTVIGSDREKGLFVWEVPGLLLQFDYPQGRPDLIAPSGDSIQVSIAGDIDPGTPTLHYDTGGGFTTVSLVPLGGDLYDAVFPAITCGTPVDWYVSAQSDGSLLSSPGAAPATSWSTTSSLGTLVVIEDDMETDAGWNVINEALEDGQWDRGVPIGGGDRGDPATDYDGSGQCWLTDNVDGNSDLDGGPTRLISPLIDLSSYEDPIVSYARWFTNDDNDIDRLDVEVSSNGGVSWTLVESVGSTSGWVVTNFRLSDFVAPTNQVRMRFSATDNPNNSVTEAAIDALAVYVNECSGTPGDVDGDGVVDFEDLLATLAAWGPCPAPPAACPTDFDGDGVTGFLDLLEQLANWG